MLYQEGYMKKMPKYLTYLHGYPIEEVAQSYEGMGSREFG
jgi:hypothetical protein